MKLSLLFFIFFFLIKFTYNSIKSLSKSSSNSYKSLKSTISSISCSFKKNINKTSLDLVLKIGKGYNKIICTSDYENVLEKLNRHITKYPNNEKYINETFGINESF